MDTRSRYLDALGIEHWVPRAAALPAPVAPEAVVAPVTPRAPGAPVAAPVAGSLPGWSELESEVAACTQCPLHAGRTQTVFGVGNRLAEWMVIGEAPGAEEDRQGEPFVGRAGQLLNAMLRAIDLPRAEVFIANILKCRPPNNRDPEAAEVACCLGYLQRQIALVRPRMLLVVGRIAAQNLLATDAPLGTLRGQVHRFGEAGTPVVVTYHPAYLLRSPGEKRKAWEDLKLARRAFRETYGSSHGT
jgi:DNA polymerase